MPNTTSSIFVMLFISYPKQLQQMSTITHSSLKNSLYDKLLRLIGRIGNCKLHIHILHPDLMTMSELVLVT